jgi:hypothetical protein
MQYRRKAYGAQRPMTTETQAHNIVLSIVQHREDGIERTPADYQVSGILLVLVEELLRKQAA